MNFGYDEVRSDDRHRDATVGKFYPDRIKETDHCVFGGTVAASRGYTGQARDTRDGNDPATAFQKPGQRGERAIYGTKIIYRHDAFQHTCILEFFEFHPHGAARVGHKGVNSAPVFGGLFHHVATFRFDRHIRWQYQCFGSQTFAFDRELFQPLTTPGAERQLSPLASQFECQRPSDAL